MRWLLTYADLITLLMVFFIVLYSISQTDKAKYIQLVESIRAAFIREPAGMSAIRFAEKPSSAQTPKPAGAVGPAVLNPETRFFGPPGTGGLGQGEKQALMRVSETVRRALEKRGLTARVEIQEKPEGLLVSFAEMVFFDLGQAEILRPGKELLDELAPAIRDLPPSIELTVEGHTDNLPIATARFPSNWELSGARAVAVTRYLIARGVAPGRISFRGYGEFRPRYPNDAGGRERNRRIDLVFLARKADG